MKQYALIIFCSIGIYTAHAQQKSSFAIGIDYINYTKPREWNDKNVFIGVTSSKDFLVKTGFWASYFYKNKYSLRMHTSYIYTKARYGIIEEIPPNFLTSRELGLYDITVGYNVLHKHDKIYLYLYAGACYIPDYRDIRVTYISSWWDPIGGGRHEQHLMRPSAQVLFKYNPIRWVFVGVGGTYHYIYKDAQPLSLNLSLGLQI